MTAPTTPRPVAGPLFRHVAAMAIEGSKRRKLVGLLAGFHDGGAPVVNGYTLARRLNLHPRDAHALLERLGEDGHVRRVGGNGWRLADHLIEAVQR